MTVLASQLLAPKQLALLLNLPQSASAVNLLRLALRASLLCLAYLVLRTWMLEPMLLQVFRCCCCWSDCL